VSRCTRHQIGQRSGSREKEGMKNEISGYRLSAFGGQLSAFS
jgi:hypothetical protein